jgi:hypothetical protein
MSKSLLGAVDERAIAAFTHRARGRALVTLRHTGGIAAVVGERRGLARLRRGRRQRAWLTAHLGADLGIELEGCQAGVEILAQESALAGGLLPEAAVRATVIDRSGREHEAVASHYAWLVMLSDFTPGKPPLVRYLDQGGTIVPAPLPVGVNLEPVPDADERCPCCGVADWGVVASQGGGDHRHTTAICRRCRHQEQLPALLQPPVRPSAFEGRPRVRGARHSLPDLGSLPVGPYGLARHPATLEAAGGPGQDPDRVTLSFVTENGRATVETDTRASEASPDRLARQVLDDLLRERDDLPDGWEQRSDVSYGLWLNGRARARGAGVAAVSVGELEVQIDGVPVVFATATRDDRFAAVARLGETTVKIAGRGNPRAAALETVAPDAVTYPS